MEAVEQCPTQTNTIGTSKKQVYHEPESFRSGSRITLANSNKDNTETTQNERHLTEAETETEKKTTNIGYSSCNDNITDPVLSTSITTKGTTTDSLEGLLPLPPYGTRSVTGTSKTTNWETIKNSNSTIYIGGLAHRYCTETVVERIFASYGTIQRIHVRSYGGSSSSSTSSSRKPQQHPYQQSTTTHPTCSYAFCQYTSVESATNAIQAVHGRTLGGRRLIVRPAHQSMEGGGLGNSGSSNCVVTGGGNQSLLPPHREKKRIESRIEAIQKKLKSKHSNCATLRK